MADIRDWGAFIRGRWDWTRNGYERGFPRNCQFTDIDASIEFDGKHLIIETKHHDGTGDFPPPYPPTGQLIALRSEVSRFGKSVLILYGCASCNTPECLCVLGATRNQDKWHDFRMYSAEDRRKALKYQIDLALGLVGTGK